MFRRIANVLLVVLCLMLLAAPARAALITYTWETLSQSTAGVTLTASFTVNSSVSIIACNDGTCPNSIPPSNSPVPYPFPSALTAFNLNVGGLAITESSFTSEDPSIGFLPDWNLALDADAASLAGDFDLFFLGFQHGGSEQIGGLKPGGPGCASTDTLCMLTYLSDSVPACFKSACTFTGLLVASVPEPRSLWLVIAGVAMLGLVIRPRSASGDGKRRARWEDRSFAGSVGWDVIRAGMRRDMQVERLPPPNPPLAAAARQPRRLSAARPSARPCGSPPRRPQPDRVADPFGFISGLAKAALPRK